MFFEFNTIEDKIQWAILSCLWIQYIWELYLAHRQYTLCQNTHTVPSEISNVMNMETFDKAKTYSLDKFRFLFTKEIFSTILTTFVLLTGTLAIFWKWAEDISPWQGELAVSCAWLFIIQLVSTAINLPFTIYYTFVLEQKHGFNAQTWTFFVKDKIKEFFLSQAITLPLAALTIVIVQNGGDFFFVWLWLFVGIVVLVLQALYPAVIAPLFDKYTPLPAGELRTSIENLAASLKFPLGQLYVVEGSKRSAHSNAYVTGLFGSKRIVLFDTLIGSAEKPGCTNEQILAVLAHELGHWSYGHITKSMIIMQVNLLLMFGAFAMMFHYSPLYTALGFPVGLQPVLVGLIAVLQFVLAPYNAFLGFMLVVLSRRFEYQADEFACRQGKGHYLIGALVQLTKDNLGFPIYDPLYSSWHHSHPTLLERIAKIKKERSD